MPFQILFQPSREWFEVESMHLSEPDLGPPQLARYPMASRRDLATVEDAAVCIAQHMNGGAVQVGERVWKTPSGSLYLVVPEGESPPGTRDKTGLFVPAYEPLALDESS
jgi:hypothetical protein